MSTAGDALRYKTYLPLYMCDGDDEVFHSLLLFDENFMFNLEEVQVGFCLTHSKGLEEGWVGMLMEP